MNGDILREELPKHLGLTLFGHFLETAWSTAFQFGHWISIK